MNNPLYDELLNLRYIPISAIDEELPPESVVLYFKNLSQLDKRISVEPIHGVQLDLQNQNPTIVLENYKATFCLGSLGYIPVVTIIPIDDILDPEYPRQITFTGTISRTDDFIPNSILVEYYGITKRASLVDDTNWTVTFDLYEVTVDTIQTVSAIANSIDVNNPNQEGVFSDPVEEQFNVLFTEVECINSLPYTFNTESTIVKVPSDASPVLYVLDKEYGYVDTIYSNADIMLANEERAFHVSDLSVPNSLSVEVDTPDSMDYDSCSSYSIEGLFYVDQLVQTWYDHSRIGPFYVEINGEKTYLESSSRSFIYSGSRDQLKIALAPYYLSIETFLKTHGIDAKYDPDSWGSYNTGGVLVKLTQEQGTHINIGTDSSNDYQLRLDGYFQNVCQQYKTFEELENSPATITLKPINYGSEQRSSFTLLANHVPDNPDEINILTLLGVTEDIDMQTCFGSGGEE